MTDDYQRAVLDPASVFASPEEVLKRTDLSREQKLKVLGQWLTDARELSVAEGEGMAGGEPSLIERVSAALATLERAR
jgi:hypothetical protein